MLVSYLILGIWSVNQLLGIGLYLALYLHTRKVANSPITSNKMAVAFAMFIKPAGTIALWLSTNLIIFLVSCCGYCGMFLLSDIAFQFVVLEKILTGMQVFAVLYSFWWFRTLTFGPYEAGWHYLLEPNEVPKQMFGPMNAFMAVDLVIGVCTMVQVLLLICARR